MTNATSVLENDAAASDQKSKEVHTADSREKTADSRQNIAEQRAESREQPVSRSARRGAL
jgi:hypothetical protein